MLLGMLLVILLGNVTVRRWKTKSSADCGETDMEAKLYHCLDTEYAAKGWWW